MDLQISGSVRSGAHVIATRVELEIRDKGTSRAVQTIRVQADIDGIFSTTVGASRGSDYNGMIVQATPADERFPPMEVIVTGDHAVLAFRLASSPWWDGFGRRILGAALLQGGEYRRISVAENGMQQGLVIAERNGSGSLAKFVGPMGFATLPLLVTSILVYWDPRWFWLSLACWCLAMIVAVRNFPARRTAWGRAAVVGIAGLIAMVAAESRVFPWPEPNGPHLVRRHFLKPFLPMRARRDSSHGAG